MTIPFHQFTDSQLVTFLTVLGEKEGQVSDDELEMMAAINSELQVRLAQTMRALAESEDMQEKLARDVRAFDSIFPVVGNA